MRLALLTAGACLIAAGMAAVPPSLAKGESINCRVAENRQVQLVRNGAAVVADNKVDAFNLLLAECKLRYSGAKILPGADPKILVDQIPKPVNVPSEEYSALVEADRIGGADVAPPPSPRPQAPEAPQPPKQAGQQPPPPPPPRVRVDRSPPRFADPAAVICDADGWITGYKSNQDAFTYANSGAPDRVFSGDGAPKALGVLPAHGDVLSFTEQLRGKVFASPVACFLDGASCKANAVTGKFRVLARVYFLAGVGGNVEWQLCVKREGGV